MGQKWGTSYEVSEPNEYIVKTGIGIKDVNVTKAAMKWPLQMATRINVSPQNYEFSLHAMSSEKLQFLLPGVFTIGPNMDPGNSEDQITKNLEKYAMFLGTADQKQRDDTIKGIIEGEVRVQSASMTLEEIFKDRIAFKKNIVDATQVELDQFGLKVFNANIKELEDALGSEYFSYMRQKTRSGAENEAKINIAEANNRGAVGQAEKEANTRVTTASINARTVIAENEQKQNVLDSNTNLQLAQIEKETQIKLQRVQQEQDISKRNLELEKQVEEVRQKKRLEELRATKGTDAQIAAEVLQKETDANYYKQVKNADANLYQKQKEAEGILILADAQKKALEEYYKVFTDPNTLLNYLMIEKGLFTEMATINAKAIQGLNPQITVWNTGGANGAEGSDPYASMRNIFQAMPPILSTIQQQTGITPPQYMGRLPNEEEKPKRNPSRQN
jgi:flotillin